MLQIEDANVLTDFEEAEKATPSYQEVVNAERAIYGSRGIAILRIMPSAHLFCVTSVRQGLDRLTST